MAIDSPLPAQPAQQNHLRVQLDNAFVWKMAAIGHGASPKGDYLRNACARISTDRSP